VAKNRKGARSVSHLQSNAHSAAQLKVSQIPGNFKGKIAKIFEELVKVQTQASES